jgi:predicted transposase YdaD
MGQGSAGVEVQSLARRLRQRKPPVFVLLQRPTRERHAQFARYTQGQRHPDAGVERRRWVQTDVPLKTLTQLCPADVLALLGAAGATVLGVESLELPTTATAVDTLLRLHSPQHGTYLHLLEWQGYRDPLFLWRLLGYLAWLGQNRPERPLAASVVYLHPGDDTGDTLHQEVPGLGGWSVRFHVVRLWEQDAQAALASGRPGLAVLSPLMRGATAELVEQAAQVVLAETPADQRQADLLTILGILGEDLMDTARYVRLLGKERLMASKLISYLAEDLVAERTAALQRQAAEERAALQRQVAEERAALQRQVAEERAALVEAITDAVAVRFPDAPIGPIAALGQLHDAERLRVTLRAVLRATDQREVEAALRAAVAAS